MQIRLPGAVFTILYAVEETTGPREPWREVARYETRALANQAIDSLPASGSYRVVPVAPQPQRAVRPQSLAREGYERAWHDKGRV